MSKIDVTTNALLRLVDWTATSDRLKPVQKRQSDVVRELLETHMAQVYRFALYMLKNHHAAQDVAQEALLRAWRDRNKIRKHDSAQAWLLKITGNLCRDYQRRNRHAVSQASEFPHDPTDTVFGPLEAVIYDEKQRLIQQMISALPPRERTTLYLSAFEQLSHSEISEVMQINVGAVKVALSRARKTVRQQLIEKENESNQNENLRSPR